MFILFADKIKYLVVFILRATASYSKTASLKLLQEPKFEIHGKTTRMRVRRKQPWLKPLNRKVRRGMDRAKQTRPTELRYRATSVC